MLCITRRLADCASTYQSLWIRRSYIPLCLLTLKTIVWVEDGTDCELL